MEEMRPLWRYLWSRIAKALLLSVMTWLEELPCPLQQNSLLEAMATGCYCLSHFWDGADEVLPPENLFVTDRELCAKVLAYDASPEPERRRQQFRMCAIPEEKFNLQRSMGEMRKAIQDTMGA
jgi:glycosyltransferase involved in cell wall biosynthesis